MKPRSQDKPGKHNQGSPKTTTKKQLVQDKLSWYSSVAAGTHLTLFSRTAPKSKEWGWLSYKNECLGILKGRVNRPRTPSLGPNQYEIVGLIDDWHLFCDTARLVNNYIGSPCFKIRVSARWSRRVAHKMPVARRMVATRATPGSLVCFSR